MVAIRAVWFVDGLSLSIALPSKQTHSSTLSLKPGNFVDFDPSIWLWCNMDQHTPTPTPSPPAVVDGVPSQNQTGLALPLRLKSNSISQKSSTNYRKHAKRLTLQFPIAISDSVVQNSQARRQQQNDEASHGDAAMFFQTSRPDSVDPSLVNPNGFEADESDDGTSFFTALAAQERKVLELREELQKAEAELTSLKRQWAVSERSKKKSEIRFQTEAMKSMRRPSTTSTDAGSRRSDDPSGLDALREQTRFSRELGRRGSYSRHSPSMSMASNASASPRAAKPRTVFQSSKHTRTLSLLANNSTVSFPQPGDIRNKPAISSKPSRSATLPSIDVTKQSVLSPQSHPPDTATLRRVFAQNPTAEAFMRTGQQMAADFKDNLWTFLEDIRQATVGEELTHANSRSVQAPNPNFKPDSRNARRTTGRSISGPVNGSPSGHLMSGKDEDDDASFWKQFGLEVESPMSSNTGSRKTTPKPIDQQKSSRNKQQQQEASLLDFDDDDDTWDMWDNSPVNHSRSGKGASHTPCSSTSTWPSKRSQSPSTAASSPPMSARFADKPPAPVSALALIPALVPEAKSMSPDAPEDGPSQQMSSQKAHDNEDGHPCLIYL